MGAADEALALLRPILEHPPKGPPFDTRVAFVHAQALWLVAPADRPHAHTLANTVETTLVARLGEPTSAGLSRENDASELAEVRSWLSAHPQ